MKVYLYNKCSTCKKAMQFLDSKGVKYQPIEIKETPPTVSELKKMLSLKGNQLKKLFNTSGDLYREMGLSATLNEMSEGEALKLLSENGMLVKRPFLLADTYGLLGFKESEWNDVLK